MNRFDEAAQDLLSTAPAVPGLDALRSRTRRRRQRRAIAIAAMVGIISLASVGVAASLGHDSSSPHIAVSPTTSTTSTTAAASRHCPAVDALKQQETELEGQAKRLGTVLKTATDEHAPNAGVLDAQHQAVLRQLSDVIYQRLTLEHGTPCAAANDPSATTPSSVGCEPSGAHAAALRALTDERRQLNALEREINIALTSAVNANSPDAGLLDARHQAVLRRQTDVEQQIVAAEIGPRTEPGCSPGA